MKLAALIVSCIFLAAVAHAETLRGTVTERISGARVPGAAVHVGSNAFDTSTTTDSQGIFEADVPSAGCTVNGLPCAVDCCVPARPSARPVSGPSRQTVTGETVTSAVRPG